MPELKTDVTSGCDPDSASTSWPAAKFALIVTVAPVIVASGSGSVSVSAASIFAGGSFSVYARLPAEVVMFGSSATHVTVIETVVLEPPGVSV